jgi:hypothetical protein
MMDLGSVLFGAWAATCMIIAIWNIHKLNEREKAKAVKP